MNVEAFISGVRAARVFDLGFTWDQSSPVLSLNPPYAFALNATHRQTHEIFGTAPGSQVSWASEILYMSGQHGAPTIDAIGHIGRNLKLHGGVDAVQATSRPDGIGNDLGIDAFPRDLLLSRGILLDVARVVANGAADPLPPGFEITGKHLEDAAQAHGVRVGRGDSVLIRTGWGQYFAKDNARYLGEKSPGPGRGRGPVAGGPGRAAHRHGHRHLRGPARGERQGALPRPHADDRGQRHLPGGEREPRGPRARRASTSSASWCRRSASAEPRGRRSGCSR